MPTLEFYNKPKVYIDVRTKLFALVSVGFIALQAPSLTIQGVSFFIAILLTINSNKPKSAIAYALAFVLLVILSMFILPHLDSALGVALGVVYGVLVTYLVVIVIFLVIINTTTVSEYVASFAKMKVSPKITIPFAVMFRFFPTLSQEWQSIQDAMVFRGIEFSAKNIIRKPAATFEYVIVPLLMSSMNIADELSAAALSRGLDHTKKRSSLITPRLRFVDYLLMIIYLTLCVTSATL